MPNKHITDGILVLTVNKITTNLPFRSSQCTMSRPLFERKTAQGRLGVIANIACYWHKLLISKTISVSKQLMSQAETEIYEKEIVAGT